MAKTNSHFKLEKTTKYIMATILDPVRRNIYKKTMIDAQVTEVAAKSRKWSDPAVSQKPKHNPHKLNIESDE